MGFETIGIASVRVAPVTIHVNLGGGLDRHAARPFGFWGIIGELPVRPKFRVVAEITGESVQGERANNSALIGVIWQPSSRNVFWDAAVRRGISRGARTAPQRAWRSFLAAAIVRQHRSVRLDDVTPGDVVDLYGVRTLAWPTDTTTSITSPLQASP